MGRCALRHAGRPTPLHTHRHHVHPLRIINVMHIAFFPWCDRFSEVEMAYVLRFCEVYGLDSAAQEIESLNQTAFEFRALVHSSSSASPDVDEHAQPSMDDRTFSPFAFSHRAKPTQATLRSGRAAFGHAMITDDELARPRAACCRAVRRPRHRARLAS